MIWGGGEWNDNPKMTKTVHILQQLFDEFLLSQDLNHLSLMKQEPVSTTQVSSGRLDSRRVLLGDEKYCRPSRESNPGLWFASQRATAALPGARYLSCEIQDSYICTLKSSFDKSDWAARPRRELLPRPDAAGRGSICL